MRCVHASKRRMHYTHKFTYLTKRNVQILTKPTETTRHILQLKQINSTVKKNICSALNAYQYENAERKEKRKRDEMEYDKNSIVHKYIFLTFRYTLTQCTASATHISHILLEFLFFQFLRILFYFLFMY